MQEKLSGIVLGGINFGENDKILKIFTLEKGVVSAKIKGVKRAGAKLKFASEPFCFAQYIFSTTQSKRTVINASLIDSFYPIREDIEKFFCAGTMAEFCKVFLMENIVSEELFVFFLNGLKEIAYGSKDGKSLLVKFLLDALKEVGYALNLNGCYHCGCEIDGKIYFDFLSGAFCCENCFDNNGREINLSTYIALKNSISGKDLDSNQSIPALKLLSFYLANRPEERLRSLEELLKIQNQV